MNKKCLLASIRDITLIYCVEKIRKIIKKRFKN